MTNEEIIIRTATVLGLFTPEFIESCLASGHELPLHTFQGWKERGYFVKKGEKGTPITIWNYANKKEVVKGRDRMTGEITEEEINNGHYYQHKAFFFTINQVRKVV